MLINRIMRNSFTILLYATLIRGVLLILPVFEFLERRVALHRVKGSAVVDGILQFCHGCGFEGFLLVKQCCALYQSAASRHLIVNGLLLVGQRY